MRILHVIAGARDARTDALMAEAVLALSEAGLEQHVVTRESYKAGVSAFEAAEVPFSIAAFDKLKRDPTKAVIRNTAQKFTPDIVQYWLGRASVFAPKALRARSIGWHGGFHKLARFKHCEWHIAASHDIAQRIIEEGAQPERVAVAPPFAEAAPAAAADRAALRTPENAPVVLAFSRLHRKKRLDTLIEAMAQVPDTYLWLVGEGDGANEVAEFAARAGIAARTRILGQREDRAALLGACDAVALPASVEPFGLVAAEAWAAGRPMVVLDHAGPAAGVTDEVDALIAPSDDAGGIAAQLRRVLEDGELARRIVDNGARAYEHSYTRTAFVRASMAFYERVRASVGDRKRAAA